MNSTLAIIDEYQHVITATVDLDHISRQREAPSTKPNLSPHLKWKGLSIVSQGEVGTSPSFRCND